LVKKSYYAQVNSINRINWSYFSMGWKGSQVSITYHGDRCPADRNCGIMKGVFPFRENQESNTMKDQPVVLVTGASSGIGEATAWKFAQQGYRVVLAARRRDRLQALADKIVSAGGAACPVETDVTKLADIQRLVQIALEEYSQIDVLVNNAGFGRLTWLENLDPVQDIELQVQVNLLGVIQTTRMALPSMIQRRKGHIINMASIAGLIAPPTYSIYSATKFAVRGFSEALRREVGCYDIHVSVIYPGGVETEFKGHTGIKRKTGITTPGRMRLSADQVAEAVWRVVKRPKKTVVIPSVYRVATAFNALFPGMTDWIIEKRFTKVERDL
jgi:short-subunit dehydrogenase